MSIGRTTYVLFLGAAVAAGVLREPASPEFETRERARIRAHFDSVLRELRGRDVSGWAPVARMNRQRLIAALDAYRDRGVFPRNYDSPDRAIPTFIDSRTGVRCAVGHLIETTGRGDITTRIAGADNHVYVIELGGDTAFRSWLGANGITLAEAARIQVPYAWEPALPPPRAGLSERAVDGIVGLLAAGAGSMTFINATQSPGQSRWMAATGVAIGAISLTAGREALAHGEVHKAIGRAAVGVGMASVVMGAIQLLPQAREATSAVNISPTMSLPVDAEARVGFKGKVRF